jgi:hypothetical protein
MLVDKDRRKRKKENDKLEAKINGLKQEYKKIGLQVTKAGYLTKPYQT